MIRRAMAKAMAKATRKASRPAVSYKRSVAPATITMMNLNAPVSTRPTRKAAQKAIERISVIVNTKKAREAERATREEVAAEEAARKARRAAAIEKKEFVRPVGTRGESMANITQMFSMMSVPSSGVKNSNSPVPVYRTRRKLSPVKENY